MQSNHLTSKTPSELPAMDPTGLTIIFGLSHSHHLSGKVIFASLGKGLSSVMSLRVVCLAGASNCPKKGTSPSSSTNLIRLSATPTFKHLP